MKTAKNYFAAWGYIIPAILIVLSVWGCGNANIGRHYDFIEPAAKVNNNIGYLKIYTESYEEKRNYDEDYYTVYKGYSVYSKNGDHVTDVGKFYTEPEPVKLKSGEYIIVAEFHKNIIQSFEIKIEPGKIFEVDQSMVNNPLAYK
jgi:hypothetical protein